MLLLEKQVVEEAVASATSKAASTKATTEELVSKKTTGNVWTRSKNFAKLTDWAFKTIDADGKSLLKCSINICHCLSSPVLFRVLIFLYYLFWLRT